MKDTLHHIKSRILGDESARAEVPEVVEASIAENMEKTLTLRLIVLESYGDTEDILRTLRNGDTMAVVKIRPLRDKDMSELKRAINRLKTHCTATGAQMAALDDNWVMVVPPTVELERAFVE